MHRQPLLLALAALLTPVAAAQCSLQTFAAADSAPNDAFGRFAVDGSRMLVGAPGHDHIGLDAGAAYVFERGPGGAWTERTELFASDGGPGDAFGGSVALLGDLAVVGAALDSPIAQFSGSAYVFERNALGQWIETAKLVPNDGGTAHLFGSGLAITGPDELWVGAPQATSGGQAPGAVYVYRRTTGGWTQALRLVQNPPQNGLRFGAGLDRSGDRVAVIAAPVGAPEYAQTVVFERTGQTWSQTATIQFPGGAFGDLDGARMLVVSPYFSTPYLYTGHARVLDLVGGSWTVTAEFEPEVPSSFVFFGLGRAISGDSILLGSKEGGGRLYHLERDAAGQWAEVPAPDVPPDYQGIGALGLAADRGFLGIDSTNLGDTGSVTELLLGLTEESYCYSLPNTTGSPAAITASRCNRVSENAFSLSASPVPNQPGFFYYGTQTTLVPLGGGYRCVSGALYRFPIQWAQLGALHQQVDLTSPPAPAAQVQAGSTWNFQAWYRDPFAAATSNLSDAVTVRFF